MQKREKDLFVGAKRLGIFFLGFAKLRLNNQCINNRFAFLKKKILTRIKTDGIFSKEFFDRFNIDKFFFFLH